jgi:nitrogen-specific signal transduction histidine kinase
MHTQHTPIRETPAQPTERDERWKCITALVDTVRGPFLILDKELRVLAANESFYSTFQVEAKRTEHQLVYELGNGQWNIPALRKLLEEILPSNTFFKGFEVTHSFPGIGRKVMLLNARRVVQEEHAPGGSAIIFLAMEDITELLAIAEQFATQTKVSESHLTKKLEKLERQTEALAREVASIKLQSL